MGILVVSKGIYVQKNTCKHTQCVKKMGIKGGLLLAIIREEVYEKNEDTIKKFNT